LRWSEDCFFFLTEALILSHPLQEALILFPPLPKALIHVPLSLRTRGLAQEQIFHPCAAAVQALGQIFHPCLVLAVDLEGLEAELRRVSVVHMPDDRSPCTVQLLWRLQRANHSVPWLPSQRRHALHLQHLP
jgi:hypothetical protein